MILCLVMNKEDDGLSFKFVIVDRCFVSLVLFLLSSIDCCMLLEINLYKGQFCYDCGYLILDGEFSDFEFFVDYLGIF